MWTRLRNTLGAALVLTVGLALSGAGFSAALAGGSDVPDFPLPTPGRGGEIHDLVRETVRDSQERREVAKAETQRWLDARFLPGHLIRVLPTGRETHLERVNAVFGARHSIYLSSFAFYGDAVGKTFGTLLCEKARSGLDVRLMLDGYGSRKLKKESKYIRKLRDCGISVLFYNDRSQWGLNNIAYALHEKLLVVDGETVIMGGSGWSKNYATHKLEGTWRDLDTRIDGPAACRFHNSFLENLKAVESWEQSSRFSRVSGKEALRKYGRDAPYRCQESHKGDSRVLPIHANPFFTDDRPILAAYAAMMQVTEGEIRLYAPYFVPERRFAELLEIYARLGRKVVVITNSVGSNDDSPNVMVAMYKTVRRLLRAGVEIRLWQRKSTMHRKGGIFGGKYAYFGSDNLDRRGQNYSSETIAATDDPEIVRTAIAEYDEDLKHTLILTEEMHRRDWRKFSGLIKFYIDYIIDYM